MSSRWTNDTTDPISSTIPVNMFREEDDDEGDDDDDGLKRVDERADRGGRTKDDIGSGADAASRNKKCIAALMISCELRL
mmetsp:Transcript_38189/g.88872  ORF Transcript_38189/g.88872 Transcript_38189/m.88872 type:complete len:80 (-) Transcript_38189:97-336(-)